MSLHRQSRLIAALYSNWKINQSYVICCRPLPAKSALFVYPSSTNNNIITNDFTSSCQHRNKIAGFDEVKAVPKTNTYLIDVREPSELIETGKIPGSINIPLGELESALKDMPAANFEQCYGRSKPTKGDPIIFSCKIGQRSQRALELAMRLGYENVKNYLGSWQDWQAKTKH